MKVKLDNKIIELEDNNGVHIPENRIEDWVNRAYELAKDGGFGYITSGDSMVLVMIRPPDCDGPHIEVWKLKVEKNGYMFKENNPSLKSKNTTSNATHCDSCGAELKDPGMGPSYKHCPICEP